MPAARKSRKEKHETDHDRRRYKPTLTTPQPAIMAVMGIALWLCNVPNTVEVMAAIVNCVLPKRADAAPALVLKGASPAPSNSAG